MQQRFNAILARAAGNLLIADLAGLDCERLLTAAQAEVPSPDPALSKVLSVMHSRQSDPICHATGNVSSGLFPDSEIPLSSPPFPRDTTTLATYPPVMCS